MPTSVSHALAVVAIGAAAGARAKLVGWAAACYLFPWRPIAAAPDLHEFFTTAYGLGVLRDEALWIWLPSLALLAIAAPRRRAG